MKYFRGFKYKFCKLNQDFCKCEKGLDCVDKIFSTKDNTECLYKFDILMKVNNIKVGDKNGL